MKTILASVLSCAFAACVSYGGESTQPNQKYASPPGDAGELQAISDQLKQIFQFTFQGPRIAINRAAWSNIKRDPKERAANGPFNVEVHTQTVRINRTQFGSEPNRRSGDMNSPPVPGFGPPPAFGPGQFTRDGFPGQPFAPQKLNNALAAALSQVPSSGIGLVFQRIQEKEKPSEVTGSELRHYFRGENLSGQLGFRGDAVRLEFEEPLLPERTLQLAIEMDGAFRIQYGHPAGDYIFLEQTRDHGFSVVSVCGGEVFAEHGNSYSDFLLKHRPEMDNFILPTLAKIGICPVPASYVVATASR
jgi:hypothetical protein